MYRKIVVGYKADRHGEEALALARLLSTAKSVDDVIIAHADGGSSDAILTRGWPRHVSVRAVPGSSSADAFRAIADEQGADVIVLGSTHRGFVGRTLRGTTADHLDPGPGRAIAVAPTDFRQAAGLRRIGVAFDGSDGAGAALAWAVDLASQFSAGLRLIGVVEPPPPPVETWGGSVPGEIWADGFAPTQEAAVVEAIRDRMRAELEAARASVGRSDVETATHVGDTVQELRRAAADLDMLVVGAHERAGLASSFGSVSRGLSHSCPAPLTVVTPKEEG
jgi:nucleotide-binding universal stress UspA family protein